MKVLIDSTIKTVTFDSLKFGQMFVYHDAKDKPHLFIKLETVNNNGLFLNAIVVATDDIVGHYKYFENDTGVLPVTELRVKL